MTLREQIARDYNDALKARDERRLSALRLLRTEIKKREVSGQKKELSEPEVMESISTLVKQRRESIRLFAEGGRQDLVEKEEAELQVPPFLSSSSLIRRRNRGVDRPGHSARPRRPARKTWAKS